MKCECERREGRKKEMSNTYLHGERTKRTLFGAKSGPNFIPQNTMTTVASLHEKQRAKQTTQHNKEQRKTLTAFRRDGGGGGGGVFSRLRSRAPMRLRWTSLARLRSTGRGLHCSHKYRSGTLDWTIPTQTACCHTRQCSHWMVNPSSSV